MSWIKMRSRLRDEREVIAIAARLGVEEDLIAGKLLRFWGWADETTVDGIVRGVTGQWVDKHVSLEGFADAMVQEGWLLFQEGCLVIPKFDEYLSKCAKKRAVTAKRMAKGRGKGKKDVTLEAKHERNKSDACSVTTASPREDQKNSFSFSSSDSSSSSSSEEEKMSDSAQEPTVSIPFEWREGVHEDWEVFADAHQRLFPKWVRPDLSDRLSDWSRAHAKYGVAKLVRALEWLAGAKKTEFTRGHMQNIPVKYLFRNLADCIESSQSAAGWEEPTDPESATASYDPIKAFHEYREQERKAASGA